MSTAPSMPAGISSARTAHRCVAASARSLTHVPVRSLGCSASPFAASTRAAICSAGTPEPYS